MQLFSYSVNTIPCKFYTKCKNNLFFQITDYKPACNRQVIRIEVDGIKNKSHLPSSTDLSFNRHICEVGSEKNPIQNTQLFEHLIKINPIGWTWKLGRTASI